MTAPARLYSNLAGGEDDQVRRRSLGVLLGVFAIGLGLVVPHDVSTAQIKDLQAEQAKVRAERARVAAQIDTSKATLAEIDAALQAINEELRAQEATLADIEADIAAAEQQIVDAEAAIVSLNGEIDLLRDEMRTRAVRAYVNPPGDDVLTVLETNDFTTAANHKFYLELRSQGDADVADKLKGATADIAHEREKADEARQVAEEKRVEQAEVTEAVRQAQANQQRIEANMQATLDSQVALSLELYATDEDLAKRIADEQAAIAARLAAERAAREEAARRAAARRASSSSASSGPITSGGPVSSGSGVSVCSVSGLTSGVNCQIKDKVVAMLSAAQADGVTLRGHSYRDSAAQIRLRQQHCGSSSYAIYQMSANSCRPPTAQPGRSQHELGLAIDFSNCSRSSDCFRWLSANASRFGFYNLPSESWHWSTTGN